MSNESVIKVFEGKNVRVVWNEVAVLQWDKYTLRKVLKSGIPKNENL